MSVTELKNETFKEFIKEGKTIVDFWASWCGPCKMLAPNFSAVAEKITTVRFGKVNIEEAPEVAQPYGIVSIPCLILFENGEEKGRLIGLSSEEKIKEKISSIFNE